MDTSTLILSLSAALMAGVAKTGMPGLAMVAVSFMAMAFPAKESIGLLLLLFLVGDVFAIAFYRRYADIKELLRLAPWVAAGLIAGGAILSILDNQTIKPVLGTLVLVLLAVDLYQKKRRQDNYTANKLVVALMGMAAGCATTVGNAAGPVITIYFVMMKMDKHKFMGTGAWFFLAVNCSKVPIYIYLDVIKIQTFSYLIWTAPLVVLGALLGKRMLALIPQALFNQSVLLLAGAAALWLIIG